MLVELYLAAILMKIFFAEKKKEKNAFIQKIAKEYKVFAEGEGPPPDPAYSFLADVERDGEKSLPTNLNPINKGSNKNNFERKNPNNRSGRLGNAPTSSNNRGGRGGGGAGSKSNYNGNLQRSLSTNEHDGRLRPDHNRYGPNRTAGGGPAEGRWRHDRDVDRSKDDCCIQNQSNGFKGEPNLTVSVSQDGEFKSVKGKRVLSS